MKSVFSFQFLVNSLHKTVRLFYGWRREVSLKTKNFNPQTNQGGYSLVEVLVAITVLLVALVGPLTIAHSGLKRSYFAKEQVQAVFFAQEGIEAVIKLREDNALAVSDYSDADDLWVELETAAARCASGCGVLISEGGEVVATSFYTCSGDSCVIDHFDGARVPYKQGQSGGEPTIYTREITMTINDTYAQVRSEVSWSDDSSDRVMLETYLYNTYYAP